MEKHLLNSPQQHEEKMDEILAEQFLNNTLLTFRRERLKLEIDKTLTDRDKKEFMRLTEELKSIS
ncbi:IDEAL domain-containing protein [Bacillus sp. DTU_2020_1000418_1_SI_GHA_SEK_038]|uniref:IDEAL domain-containing protein n=1 Tax=Bacillus sp. DTU_2020_1000418_1_SI_GHA_SEK_038 TaxID=3077585 RepID=UPI0028E9B11A|nr:IDEAL domain-containing protein [Bacillus sp. DTU_2020_1000418_1_SI_GHA_SEK_038]WNS73724.1 IDEAL domain-containing protein [Bacillus sp. DTU_2020_1000418_1_SI_GHA_SEK_038]